jgi:hypothetical protein
MFRNLSSSFAKWTLALICIASFSLMLWAARTDSAIDDELAHIPAGYGYVHNLDYRLNPEHPPLVKALAMLPVLFLNPTYPTNSAAWTTEVNGQWDMGSQFLYQSGNDADAIIQTARIMPILLTILTIIFVYLLARRLMGDWWALLPTFLFAFDPTILGQGHYVTTDVGAAFGVIFSTYFFLKYIESPSTKHLWWAGLAFGIAQVTKFSTPLVTVLFIFLTLVMWVREMAIQWHGTDPSRRFKKFLMRGLGYLWKLILIIVIGYIFIVYPIYFLFTVHYPIAKQVSDTTTILASFATGPTPAGQLCTGMRCFADLDIWMAHNPITRPYAQYLLGLLMVLQRADAGNTIYFLGHIVNSGGWIYFPVLLLLKEPIPTLALIFLALGLTISQFIKKRNRFLDYLGTNFAEFSLASFVVLYWGIALHSQLNLGIRYVLPTFSFIYILTGGVIKKWATRINIASLQNFGSVARALSFSAIKYIFLLVLLVWLFFETIFAAPYFLSYFNEFGGGVWGGYRYVTDSNYDWGQDLLRLQSFVNAHPEIDKIAVDYFGGGSPQYYLGNKDISWSSSKGDPADQGIHWFAISVNQLQGATEPLVPGETRNASDTYSWLTALYPPAPGMGNVPPPTYRIGTSIFVYKL